MERFSVKGNNSQIHKRSKQEYRLRRGSIICSISEASLSPRGRRTRHVVVISVSVIQLQIATAPGPRLAAFPRVLSMKSIRSLMASAPRVPGSTPRSSRLNQWRNLQPAMLRAGPISLHAVHCSPGTTRSNGSIQFPTTVAVGYFTIHFDGIIILVCDYMKLYEYVWMIEWLILLVIILKISRLDRVFTSYHDDLLMLTINSNIIIELSLQRWWVSMPKDITCIHKPPQRNWLHITSQDFAILCKLITSVTSRYLTVPIRVWYVFHNTVLSGPRCTGRVKHLGSTNGVPSEEWYAWYASYLTLTGDGWRYHYQRTVLFATWLLSLLGNPAARLRNAVNSVLRCAY